MAKKKTAIDLEKERMRKEKEQMQKEIELMRQEIFSLQEKVKRSEEQIRQDIFAQYEEALKDKDKQYAVLKRSHEDSLKSYKEQVSGLREKIQELKNRPQNNIKSGQFSGKRGRKPLPDETKQKVLELKAAGKTVKEIAELCGVSRGSVYWITHPEAADARRKGAAEQ